MAFPGSLCPGIPCAVWQRAGTETRPYNGGCDILPKTLHTPYLHIFLTNIIII